MDEILMMLFDWIMKHPWAQYVVAAFGVLKIATTFMPSTWQGKSWYNIMMKAINTFTLNVGKAKNADDKPLALANAK